MSADDDFDDNAARELTDLRGQITYLQEALNAISGGGVDAVVIGEPDAEQVYTLTSADRPYRVIVEEMGEGAATVSESGVILFANPQLASFLGVDRDSMIGRDLADYVAEDQHAALVNLLGASSTATRRAELQVAGSDGGRCRSMSRPPTSTSTASLVRCLVLTDLTMQKLVERELAEEVDAARAAARGGGGQRHHRPGPGGCGDGARPRSGGLRATPGRQHLAPCARLDRPARR